MRTRTVISGNLAQPGMGRVITMTPLSGASSSESSADEDMTSAQSHRFSSVCDMHYDIAKRERKNSTNAIVTTYWYYKKILVSQFLRRHWSPLALHTRRIGEALM
jgi:hypothetical protein